MVGHVEWVDFVRLDRPPRSGDIVHARAWWEQPAGGGSVAAVQLARLAGGCTLFTALGDDDLGRRARAALGALGLRVEAAARDRTRRAITFVDGAGERTITVLGARLDPRAADPLPWDELAAADAVYVCAGDAAAVRFARRARVLVATARALPTIAEAGIALDALVGSAGDPSERYARGELDPAPGLVVRTEGSAGGTFSVGGGPPQRFEAAPMPGPVADTYGAGDAFAAGLAFALASGHAASEAVAFAARCGAAVLTGNGPYEGMMRSGSIGP